MNIFGIDNAFYRIGAAVFDMMIILFLWIITSVLGFGFTVGASTTAAFYAIDKTIINNRGYVTKSFLKSFLLNFKKATILWLFIVTIIIIMGLTFIEFNKIGDIPMIVTAISYVVFFELSSLLIYSFTILAKIEISIKELIVKSLLLAHKHLLTTITSISIIVVFIVLTIKINSLFVFVGFVVWSYLNSKLIVGNLLVKYIDQEKLALLKTSISDEL